MISDYNESNTIRSILFFIDNNSSRKINLYLIKILISINHRINTFLTFS